MNRAAVNQHLQFTELIWATEANPSLPAEEDRIQVVMNDKFPFIDMKLSWSLEGDLQFSVFGRKGKQLKCVEK